MLRSAKRTVLLRQSLQSIPAKRFFNSSTSRRQPPERAEVVIIGGGCIGCGVAYSLAEAGKTDVVLLEKESSLASVTTAAAAGLVGQVRNNRDRVKLAMWSVKTFSDLQKNEEANPNWRQVGSIRVAHTEERVQEFEQMKKICDEAGLAVQIISPAEAEARWKGMNFRDTKSKPLSILWCPSDGYLQPSDLANSYVALAAKRGVRFFTNSAVERIELDTDSGVPKVTSVRTTSGRRVQCDTVINAAGYHAYHIAQLVGLKLPIFPVRHEYFITEPVPGKVVHPTHPCFRFPDMTLYGRPDVNSLLCGGWEPNGLSLDPTSYTIDQSPPGIDEDWPVLLNFAENLANHYPTVKDLGIRQVLSGWPTFSPDGRFIIGPSTRVRGFIMAGACNAHGVSGSAGIGKYVVQSLIGVSDESDCKYLKTLSPDRFDESTLKTPETWKASQEKSLNIYQKYYFVTKTS